MKTNSYIAWCNENEGRAYPLTEEATRLDDTGKTFENDIIVDMGILLPEYYTGLRISSVYISAQLISVAISANSGGLLTGTYARAGVVPYTAYPLTPIADNASGWIVFGNHRTATIKHYRFATAEQSGLEQRPVRVLPPPGVQRFQRVDNDPTIYATGIVKLDGGLVFVIDRDPDDAQNIIVRLNNDVAASFIEPCTRQATSDACGVPPIRRINNVPATAAGVITLRFE